MNVGSRDGGQSATAKDAYIEREDRYAQQDPEECEHVEHGHMPAWAQDDPRTYWAAADDHERANGRLYREVQFALPNELSPEARRDLAPELCRAAHRGRAVALYARHPQGHVDGPRQAGQPARAPDVFGARQRRD